MKWHELGELQCPIARSLSILGDRWTLLIIRNAFMSTKRFDDFQRELGITRHLLTERIQRLVEHNIFEKVLYNEAPKRYEYKLTEKGLALYPIILAFSSWGNLWQNENQEFPEVKYKHKNCGHFTRPEMTCDCCHEKIDPKQMQLIPFPENEK
ncbi:winged helix-turn-helix transcriptional regulator [Acinetobacter sichuanensis]|uniref:Transcriptional regulator n=1 Tax=Acinetobacter sichuanensis TaxID=2136183 RepID=A0A371YQY4_9GAMM|nr:MULTISPECIES: helix-turn-helix domain-containing protein [Acinetobacter]MDM1247657.1 helix-turn-helix transcriptional regulator [Acinetobacter sp. R933-2]MDM1768129.1 helix-turn-helix transcriptional regulator [Acinetobacter sp. 226-4]MDQ9021334.1 helix-turn-helix domain-containing protein [Acinetobacter sichuanensis]RFC83880.1 transcriptional regulator [Acinetobacter sichuanensis]